MAWLGGSGSGALDPAARDPVRDDADIYVAIAAGPRPDRGVPPYVTEFGRVRDAVGRPADEHAPALAERLVEVVDLERDPVVGVALDHAALAGPDDDGARDHGEVDREHDRTGGRAERDPPDAARCDQQAAVDRQQLGDDGRLSRGPRRWRDQGPGAEQRGRGRLQR